MRMRLEMAFKVKSGRIFYRILIVPNLLPSAFLTVRIKLKMISRILFKKIPVYTISTYRPDILCLEIKKEDR
jgi:hypothetical protein